MSYYYSLCKPLIGQGDRIGTICYLTLWSVLLPHHFRLNWSSEYTSPTLLIHHLNVELETNGKRGTNADQLQSYYVIIIGKTTYIYVVFDCLCIENTQANVNMLTHSWAALSHLTKRCSNFQIWSILVKLLWREIGPRRFSSPRRWLQHRQVSQGALK